MQTIILWEAVNKDILIWSTIDVEKYIVALNASD